MTRKVVKKFGSSELKIEKVKFFTPEFNSKIFCINVFNIGGCLTIFSVRPFATWLLTKKNMYIYHHKKNTRSSVECWDHCDKIRTLNQTYPASTTHILPKFSNFLQQNWNCYKNHQVLREFLLLGLTKHYTAVKIYEKQQILLCQTAKVVNSKNGQLLTG